MCPGLVPLECPETIETSIEFYVCQGAQERRIGREFQTYLQFSFPPDSCDPPWGGQQRFPRNGEVGDGVNFAEPASAALASLTRKYLGLHQRTRIDEVCCEGRLWASRALCPGKGFVSLRWHLPAAALEMLEPGGCTDVSGVCWKFGV